MKVVTKGKFPRPTPVLLNYDADEAEEVVVAGVVINDADDAAVDGSDIGVPAAATDVEPATAVATLAPISVLNLLNVR